MCGCNFKFVYFAWLTHKLMVIHPNLLQLIDISNNSVRFNSFDKSFISSSEFVFVHEGDDVGG